MSHIMAITVKALHDSMIKCHVSQLKWRKYEGNVLNLMMKMVKMRFYQNIWKENFGLTEKFLFDWI